MPPKFGGDEDGTKHEPQRQLLGESALWVQLPEGAIFCRLKHRQLNYEKFKTYETAKLSVMDYLAFYNGRRSRSTLGYQSPLEFEREFYRNAA